MVLKQTALLASLAFHGGIFVLGSFLGWGAPRIDRPPLLLGMETSDVSGAIDQDAPPPVAEPPPEETLELPDVPISAETPPEEGPELPPDDVPPVEVTPPAFEPPPVGARKAPPGRAVPASPASTSTPTVAPLPAPRPHPPAPVLAAAPSRKGSISDDRPATRIGNAKPAYPAEALRNRWEGTTILDVRVTAEGLVASATIHQSSGYAILDEAAVAVCVGYRYLPRLVDGEPARAWLRQPFVWTVERP